MPTKAEIVNQIEEQIIPNLMELITGGILQNVLLGMVDQINTLVGELDDLNTDDRSSIVNAINELVSNIQAIEDNLTPYVYFGIDDPNIVTPVGFGGDIPSFYVQQQHSGLDVVNIGFWTYTGIIGKEWVDLSLEDVGGIQSVQAGTNINVDNTDPQNPIISSTGGSDLTLEQARLNGNVLRGGILFEDDDFEAVYIEAPKFDANFGFKFDMGIDGFSKGFMGTAGGAKPYMSYYLNGVDVDTQITVEVVGIKGHKEFDKQGDRMAFAQIADIEDRERTIRLVLTPDGEDAETGDKMSFFADGDYEIISVNATAKTAPTGSAITIGLKVNGVDVTDVPITIPNGSKTSFASTPAEFTATIELGDEITPNITAVGSTIKGQDLQLIFTYKKII